MTVSSIVILVIVAWFFWVIFRGSRRRTNIRAEWDAAPSAKPDRRKKTYILKTEPSELVQMAEPTSRLFSYQDERKAYKARQPLWIRYQDKSGNVTERVVEIYNPEDDEVIFAWCRLKREPRTFARRNIQSWQLLPERFEFDPIVAQYWEEEGTLDMSEKLPWQRWLRDQPDHIANRYD